MKALIFPEAAIYYKMMNNVKQYKAGADLLLNYHIETEVVNGKAKSYGLELSAEKTGGRVYGRVDYTYSRTLIKSVSPYKEDMINEGVLNLTIHTSRFLQLHLIMLR